MSKKQRKAGLGKALIHKLQKKRFIGTGEKAPIFYQESQVNEAQKKKMKMQSVLQQNNLTEYLHVAQMKEQNFHADRNIKFSEIREEMKNKKIIVIEEEGKRKRGDGDMKLNTLKGLQVPRRPEWKKVEKSKEGLEKLENEAYLTWRRRLAEVQESDDVTITPYEKNLEVWRQLWRVVDRCNVLVQIIDGRNPLFFYSPDLFEYARQLGKGKFLLIVNKSDLVDQKIRQQWSTYFKEQGLDFCFFTAKEGKIQEGEDDVEVGSCKVLSPHQLVTFLQGYGDQKGVQIGLTGYPNVGKSSVINALIGRKKVGVASMPGKTKHFQTLKLTDKVTLCDCPGLVFPKVHASKAEMVLNGLYPIDTLKQYEEPLQLIAYRIPREKISQLYAIYWKDNDPYDGESILVKYATLKGYFGGNGSPVQSRASKYILKDYVNGVLVYCYLPPGNEAKDGKKELKLLELEQEKKNFKKEEGVLEHNLDSQFFQKQQEKRMRSAAEVIGEMTEEDFLDLVDGRKLDGLKVTKEMRKEIKFAMKRGTDASQLRKILLGQEIIPHKLIVKY